MVSLYALRYDCHVQTMTCGASNILFVNICSKYEESVNMLEKLTIK